MVLILFVQVLKKVLKSLKFELKNPAETLCKMRKMQSNVFDETLQPTNK